MKICLVSMVDTAQCIDGIRCSLYDISKNLLKRGHQLIVITAKGTYASKEFEEINGVKTYRTIFIEAQHGAFSKKPLFNVLRFFFKLPISVAESYKILKKTRPEIIHIYDFHIGILPILIISYFTNFKLIFTNHGILRRFKACSLIRLLYRSLLKRADYIVALTNLILNEIEKEVPGISGKVTVIPCGIDLQTLCAKQVSFNTRPYLFSAGRLIHYKRFDILLFAFKSIIDMGHDVDLVIAGDGDDRDFLQGLVGLLKLDNRVHFTGHIKRPEMIDLFHGCTFFVLSSEIEMFGIVFLEAMAAGKAVLATKTGGIPEIVKNGKTGILVKPNSVLELSEAMIRLLDDVTLRNELGANGRVSARDFSMETVTDKYIDLYGRLLLGS